MSEWNFEKNQNLDHKILTYGSNEKVWWIYIAINISNFYFMYF